MSFSVIWPILGRLLGIFGKLIVFSHITGFGTEIFLGEGGLHSKNQCHGKN